MNGCLRSAIVTAMAGVLLSPAYARIAAQIRIHHSLTVEDGLVQSQLKCIYKDRDGYLWLATLGGVSRWDGLHFRNFQIQDGLAMPQVNAILQGRDGRMYLATNGGGVCVFDGARLDTLTDRQGLADNRVYAIFENDEGLFFGTQKGVSIYKDGHFRTWTTADGLAHNRVNHVFEDREGTLYLATLAGISRRTPNGWVTIREGLRDLRITRITQAPGGERYAATWGGGVVVLRDTVAVPLHLSDDIDRMIVLDVAVARDGTLWVATYGGGLVMMQQGRVQTLNTSHGLGSNTVTCLFEDPDGTMYLGTDDGVSVVREGLLETWNGQTGLADASVWAIQEGHDGKMYFGSDGKGLSVYDPATRQFRVVDIRNGLRSNQIRAVHQVADGTIYVATFGGGLSILRRGHITTIDSRHGLPNDRVKCVVESTDGSVLAGMYNGGVAVIRNDRVVDTLDGRRGLVNNFVNAICVASDSTMYVGTWGGLTMVRNGQVTSMTKDQGLPNPYVNAIFETHDHRIFVGTDGGLAILEHGAWQTMTVRDGLSNNTILGITEDGQRRVHVATNKGVNILDWSGGVLTIQTLLHSDGLASDECNQGATFRDRAGFLWFGTTKGVTRYNPRKLVVNTRPPRVHITRIRVFETDVVLPASGLPEFRYDENYLKFDFVGIHLSAPTKVAYRVRMSGVDPAWMPATQGFAQYTNLDPGAYTFEVTARNEWNYWSEPVHFRFVIRPPFWKTWWFIVLGSVGSILAGWFLYHRHVNRLLAIERMRIRIASDLHDDIGSTLTRIAATSEAIKTGRDPGRIPAMADRIGALSREVIHTMSDIVWSIDARNDTAGDLLARVQDFAGQTLASSGIAYDVITKGVASEKRLAIDVRENVYLIFKEALANIVKHARATQVTIRLENDRHVFRMTIADNGQGVGAVRKSGHGLRNIDMRARRIGGSVAWHGDHGTTMILTTPRW